MEAISWEALATVTGASFVAALVVQFVKVFYTDMTAQMARMVSAAAGLVVVVIVTILSGATDVATIVLSVIVGLQAGLAASKTYEIVKDGAGHTTVSQ